MTTLEMGGNSTTVTGLDSTAMNCSFGEDDGPSPCVSEQEWYNETSCRCQTFPLEEMTLTGPAGIAFLTVALLSVLLDLCVVVIFVQFRHTPIVKAANRELSFLLLFVLAVSFVFPIVKVGRPAVWRCVAYASRGPVTTCVYAIFLVKTHRVLSIFEARLPKVVHRQWILGRSLQLVGVFALTLVQVIISGVCMSIYPPALEYKVDPVRMVTNLDCKSVDLNNIINSAYPMLLTFLCLCFAFRARRLPENYGESRHILATMAVCFFVFFSCFGVSFFYQGTSKVIILTINESLVPIAQLVLLFFPKVYIILLCPERNTVQELRRMTLAHMQRQSEFSPTEGAARDAVGRRQKPPGDLSRLKSPRSSRSKTHCLPDGQEPTHAENGPAVRLVSVRRNSFQVVENGMPSLQSGVGVGDLPKRRCSSLGQSAEAGTVTAGTADSRPGLTHRLQSSARRKSSGLFVIQFVDETQENEGGDGDADKTPPDNPVKFNLLEKDSEGEGEGDMFAVSMLGRTLTLTVEDHRPGVPEILGGVYVGRKTAPGAARKKAEKHAGKQDATNKPDSIEGIREQILGSSDTRNCVTSNPGDSSDDGANTAQNPCDILAMGEKELGKHCVPIQRIYQLKDKVNYESKENTNKDVSVITEGAFQEVNQLAPIGLCIEGAIEDTNHIFDAITTASGSESSLKATSCFKRGQCESTLNTGLGEYPPPPKTQSIQTTDGQDAVSLCSSSSYSTFCETMVDDSRRLLSSNWREKSDGHTQDISLNESHPLDTRDLCIQVNCHQLHQD